MFGLHLDWQVIATLISSFAAAGSTYLAFRVIRENYLQRENELHLRNATLCLERAYAAFTKGGSHSSPPLPDRLAWLTTARLIEEFKRYKVNLKDKTMLQELFSHEEHWRRMFFVVIDHEDLKKKEYFNGSVIQGTEIEKRSAIIIHAFADWPEDRADPITAYPSSDEAYEKLKPSRRWLGLVLYLDKLF